MVMSAGGASVTGAASASAFARELAHERAVQWYPDLDGRLVVDTSVLATRPRCTLVDVRLAAGSTRRRVVVKVRSDRQVGGGERPSLVPDRVPAAEQAVAEHAGLRHVAAVLDPDDSRHGAVRALDLVPDAATLVLEHVDQPTLRATLLRTSRFRSPLRDARGTADLRVWSHVGSWLSRWHEWSGPAGAVPRLAARDELVDTVRAYGTYLSGRPGGRAADSVARAAAELALTELPPRMDLAASHGDFAPRNVFVDSSHSHRVAVFDPMPRWQAPPLEDVCRMLVGVRLLGLQVHTHGLALSRAHLDAIEEEFLAGYGGGRWAPGQLATFRLVVLLDKWAALAVGGSASGPRGVAARGRAAWAGRYLAREARRILAGVGA
jgi:hypothetical protein